MELLEGLLIRLQSENGFQKSTAHVNTAAMQAGLDSLGAVDFRNAVSGAFAMDIPATAAFDYPTIAALAAYISSKAIFFIYSSYKDQPFLRLASCHAWHPACIG